MYVHRLAAGAGVGSLVLGVKTKALPYTGFSTTWYVLAAGGLLVTGLLLARVHRGAETVGSPRRRTSFGRAAAVAGCAAAGLLLLVIPSWWRGVETLAIVHTIHLATSNAVTGTFGTGVVVMSRPAGGAWAFALTSECTASQLLGALLIGGAPLLLVRRLSVRRVTTALGLAALVLVVVNLIRLTAIGVAIHTWGHRGFDVSHTYLGSLLTFVGTCLAGVVFALALIRRAGPPVPVGTPG
jgi:LPXTG-motif cell wall-anchored protein